MNSYSFDLIILFNTFEKIGVLILGVRVDWVMVFEISDFKIKISGVSVFGVSVLGFRSRLYSNFWFTHCYTLLCYVHIVNVILTQVFVQLIKYVFIEKHEHTYCMITSSLECIFSFWELPYFSLLTANISLAVGVIMKEATVALPLIITKPSANY